MKVQTVTKTGAGSTEAIVINTNTNPVNIGFAVIVSGTVNYSVQFTYDDPATGFTTWFDDATITSKTGNEDGYINFPITGLKTLVNSGSGTVTMKVVQAGIA
tara:strand:+ start:64 stop:369 length:306 start_codon:yes stop_codon:yes gene_type:complete